jgi:hypothetical protein
MPLEAPGFIGDLNSAWPLGPTDFVREGDDHFRLMKGNLQRSFPGQNFPVAYGVDTGVADAYVVSLNPAISSYVEGMRIYLRVVNTNTKSVTLDVSGLGAKTVVDQNLKPLVRGVWQAGAVVELVYAGSQFIWLGALPLVENDTNLILNAAGEVWQAHGTLPFSLGPASAVDYGADQHAISVQGPTVSINREGQPPDAWGAATKISITGALATPGSSDRLLVSFPIEGLEFAPALFGKAAAKELSFGFSFFTEVPGTYHAALRRPSQAGGVDRSIVMPFTAAASTWERHTFVFEGDVEPGWVTDERGAIAASITLMAGTALQTLTSDVWQFGDFISTSSQVNFAATVGNDCYVWGPKLQIGSIATPVSPEPITNQLLKLYRYLEPIAGVVVGALQVEGFPTYYYKVSKRVSPILIRLSYSQGSGAAFGSMGNINRLGAIESGTSLGRHFFRQNANHSAPAQFSALVNARM